MPQNQRRSDIILEMVENTDNICPIFFLNTFLLWLTCVDLKIAQYQPTTDKRKLGSKTMVNRTVPYEQLQYHYFRIVLFALFNFRILRFTKEIITIWKQWLFKSLIFGTYSHLTLNDSRWCMLCLMHSYKFTLFENIAIYVYFREVYNIKH